MQKGCTLDERDSEHIVQKKLILILHKHSKDSGGKSEEVG